MRLKINKPVIWDEFTAYLYGYILGDGCMYSPVSPISNPTYGQLCIDSCDLQIIEDLRDRLDLNMRIIVNEGRKANWNTSYRIVFTSKEWYSLFKALGITPNRSNNESSIEFPSSCLNHFIRGLFDSDGCISVLNKDNGTIRVTYAIYGHDSYIRRIQDIIPINGKYLTNVNKSTISSFVITKGVDTLKFYEWIYKDATIMMKRKLDKFTKPTIF